MRVLRRSKATEILLELLKGPKHVRELQSEVGGSASTLEMRIHELLKEGWIRYEESDVWPFRKTLKLTDRGVEVVKLLKLEGGFFGVAERAIKKFALSEDRARRLLTLLHAMGGKVEGGIRLQKLIFLSKHELGLNEFSYKFAPYAHGPFSEEVSDDVVGLVSMNLMKVEGKVVEAGDGVVERSYRLTPKGEKAAKKIYDKLPRAAKSSLQSLKRFNEMKLVELLRYVYSKYPKESTG
jgi:uncharacterized protein YwgA